MELERWHFIVAGIIFIACGIILFIRNANKKSDTKKKNWRNFY